MNGIKFTFCRALTTAYALICIHHRHTAAQAALGFIAHLLFGKGHAIIGKYLINLFMRCFLAWNVVVALQIKILLIQGFVGVAITTEHEALTRLHKAVQRNRSLLAGSDSVNSKARTRIAVAANKDIGLRRTDR